ncbi:MAG: 30S ribosomal protein S15 [DPANN group archaeon]|nr:30S ribosomal protein S15 [DPANN group archaeon]
MARMHSRRKGKSKSRKPLTEALPEWVSYKPQEAVTLVLKLAKEGNKASAIGLLLRDKYQIPDFQKLTGKKINVILKENKVSHELPEDLNNLVTKAFQVKKHLETNKKDMVSKRGLQLTESKINRLAKYYKRRDVLPAKWKYEQEKATFAK